jgi:undecaprenyl diphosphate synthase
LPAAAEKVSPTVALVGPLMVLSSPPCPESPATTLSHAVPGACSGPRRGRQEVGSGGGPRPSPPPDGVDLTGVPAHVACVMDGNGRWASQRGLPRTAGHAAGEEALLDTIEGALEIGIRWLTVFAFSTENWRRPRDEVRYLMGFNESLLVRRRDELHDKGVRIRFAGRRDWRVPRRVLRRMDESTELTEKNRVMTLTMAFNYGGRAEIVDAVRALVAEGTPASRIDEKAIRAHLYYPDQPDPDLVVRTSGEYRISNFLLWELAYSELVFTDVLWPDFRRQHLFEAVAEFQRRERRYGGVRG